MKKRVFFALFLALLLQFCLVSAAAEEVSTPEFDGYIVRLSSDLPMLFSEGQSGMEYLAPGLYKVDSAMAEALERQGLVEHMEQNIFVELLDTEEEQVDTRYSWADILVKTDYAAEIGLTGAGVRVAVIDSGLELGNKNLQNAKIAAGYDYVADSGDVMSDNIGHGTKVIQMIVGDGQGQATRGIAPEATVVPFRCFHRNEDGIDGASTADLIKAIRDAADIYECDVINLSWGLTGSSTELLAAIVHATDAGAIIVASAGNTSGSQPQGTLIYPAAYSQVIGVGSVDYMLTVASSSQQTEAVDVCAPGDRISFYNTSGSLVGSSGTSFAAPAVAAMAALLREALPQLDTAALRSLIAERAIDLGESGYDTAYGYGFMRMDKMLGQSWTYAMESRIIGWLRNDGSTLVKATYNEGGRMLGSSFACAAKSLEAISENFAQSETAAFFLMGSDGAPMRGAIRTK